MYATACGWLCLVGIVAVALYLTYHAGRVVGWVEGRGAGWDAHRRMIEDAEKKRAAAADAVPVIPWKPEDTI